MKKKKNPIEQHSDDYYLKRFFLLLYQIDKRNKREKKERDKKQAIEGDSKDELEQ